MLVGLYTLIRFYKVSQYMDIDKKNMHRETIVHPPGKSLLCRSGAAIKKKTAGSFNPRGLF
jgi:hypothetical protein